MHGLIMCHTLQKLIWGGPTALFFTFLSTWSWSGKSLVLYFFWIAPADVLYSLQMFTVYIVNQHQHSLVGGLEHVLFSTIYWDNPSHWLSYFSRWLKPPTRYRTKQHGTEHHHFQLTFTPSCFRGVGLNHQPGSLTWAWKIGQKYMESVPPINRFLKWPVGPLRVPSGNLT